MAIIPWRSGHLGMGWRPETLALPVFWRRRLSVQAISWVLEFSESRLGPRHVLLSIANHAKSDGTGAWPSVDTIAHESRLSEREVRYALRELEKSGELQTETGEGPRGCNLYSLPMMGQSLQGQKTTENDSRGANSAEPMQDFAPEPSLTVLKEEPSGCARCANPSNELQKHAKDCPANPRNQRSRRSQSLRSRPERQPQKPAWLVEKEQRLAAEKAEQKRKADNIDKFFDWYEGELRRERQLRGDRNGAGNDGRGHRKDDHGPKAQGLASAL